MLWEIYTYGCTPYPGLAPELILEKLESGYRMEKPKECDEFIYDNIMLKCWNINPKQRPKFSQLIEQFEILLNKKDYVNIKQLIETNKANKKLLSLSSLDMNENRYECKSCTSSATDAIVDHIVNEKQKNDDLNNTTESINSTSSSQTTTTPSYSYNKKRQIIHPLDGNSLNKSVSIESSKSSSSSSSPSSSFSSFDNINNYIENDKNNDNEFDKEEEFLKKCLFDDNDYKNLINDIKYNYNSSSKNSINKKKNKINNQLVINSSSDIDISFKAIVENKNEINSSLFNNRSVYN